jgi:hypothetical protein
MLASRHCRHYAIDYYAIAISRADAISAMMIMPDIIAIIDYAIGH